MLDTTRFKELRAHLQQLKQEAGLCALKTGTEVEDMAFEDIRVLCDLSQGILPLYVKIGGPEARNDIRMLAEMGVDGIIAPMIESAYALKNFIKTMRELLDPAAYAKMEKGINLETITGFSNMNSILSAPEIKELNQITAARTDLSGSMGLSPDDAQVLEKCSIIVARARENDLRTSVGGNIHVGIVTKIIQSIGPHTINTRHMVLECAKLQGASPDIVNLNLAFEVKLYDFLALRPSMRQQAYRDRARTIQKRIDSQVTASL